MEELMKKQIEILSNLMVKNSGVHRNYSDEDLMNATLVFMEVFIAKLYDNHKNKLNQSQLEEVAIEAGKSLRQTIELFTGKDMHKVTNSLLKEYDKSKIKDTKR